MLDENGAEAQDFLRPEAAAREEEGREWLGSLPEELRAHAENAGDMDGLLEALERGLASLPLRDPAAVRLPAGREEQTTWARDLAVKLGLSQGQVDALIAQRDSAEEKAMLELRQESEGRLRQEYGDKYAAVIGRADDTLRLFNQKTGGALDPLIRQGLGNHHGFIKFMIALSEAVSPSSLPGNPSGPAPEASMSTEAFLNAVFNQMPGGQ